MQFKFIAMAAHTIIDVVDAINNADDGMADMMAASYAADALFDDEWMVLDEYKAIILRDFEQLREHGAIFDESIAYDLALQAYTSEIFIS